MVSPYFTELLTNLSRIRGEEENKTSAPTIKVSEVASIAAFFYEKIRQAVDYQEEHLLRRIAIERILRRRLTTESRGVDVSLPLIRELIWARYLKNNSVPQERVTVVSFIIDKYMPLIGASLKKVDKKEREAAVDWVISVLACEVEKVLVSSEETDAFVGLIFKLLLAQDDKSGTWADPETKKLQLFIAIQRAFAKSDYAILRFHLLLYFFPGWANHPDEAFIQKVLSELDDLRRKIEKQLNHPRGELFLRYMKKRVPPFLILRDVLRKNSLDDFSYFEDFSKVEEEIKTACQGKYAETKAKLTRMGVRSIIYIFITKMVFAAAVEVPWDTLVLRRLDPFPLLINTVTPPFLMFLVTTTIKPPREDNTEKIVQIIKEVVYGTYGDDLKLSLKSERERTGLSSVFMVIYLLMFLVSFGFIFYLLYKLQFSLASGAIFIFFLSVVSFFGYRIRLSANELSVLEKKDNVFTPLVDFFSIPILSLGLFLSSGFIKINIFTFIFDFIIEAPFKSIIGVFEEWMTFIRSKKDEIV